MGFTFEQDNAGEARQQLEERAYEIGQLAPETLAHLSRIAFAEGEQNEDHHTETATQYYAKSAALANLAAAGYAARNDRRNMTSAEIQEAHEIRVEAYLERQSQLAETAANLGQDERRKPATQPPYPGAGARQTWTDADMIDGGEPRYGNTPMGAARQKIDPKLGPDYDHILPAERFD